MTSILLNGVTVLLNYFSTLLNGVTILLNDFSMLLNVSLYYLMT